MKLSNTSTVLMLCSIAVGILLGARYVTHPATPPHSPSPMSSSSTGDPLGRQVGESAPSAASNDARGSETAVPEVGARGPAPEEVASTERRRAAVPLASVGGRDEASESLQAVKGALQQTLQRMLQEHPDLAQRLITRVRTQKDTLPEPADPEPQEQVQATLLPETQQALQRILPQLNQEDLRNTLNGAVNRSNEKGH